MICGRADEPRATVVVMAAHKKGRLVLHRGLDDAVLRTQGPCHGAGHAEQLRAGRSRLENTKLHECPQLQRGHVYNKLEGMYPERACEFRSSTSVWRAASARGDMGGLGRLSPGDIVHAHCL